MEVLAESGVDFIALDGFGGGTGATEFFVRENVGVPIVAALPRADKHLKKIGKRNSVSLIAGGGLRSFSGFRKNSCSWSQRSLHRHIGVNRN